MSEFVLLRPEMLFLLAVVLPIVLLPALRLRALSRLRRNFSTLLQGTSAVLMIIALAEPVLVHPDQRLSMVMLLDNSPSVSAASRAASIAYAREVLLGAKPTDTVRFIAVGAEAALITAQEIEAGTWAGQEPNAPDAQAGEPATDLEAGLRLAGSLLADEGKRRLVLLSDGWETRGAADEEAARLRSRGIDLQVVGLVALGEHEVVAESISMQSYARVGDPILSDLRVYSASPTTATMHILVDGQAASSRALLLQPGENRVSLEQKAGSVGFHRIEVRIEPGEGEDTYQGNNSVYAGLVVKPAPRVLVLQERDREGELMAEVLRDQGIEVDLAFPVAITPRVDALERYDAVVMVDVSATSFTLDQQRTLQEYVRRYGRGLVAIGGPTAFGKGDYVDSVFEEVMPVSSQPAPRPQEGETALILVLDRSSSMRYLADDTAGTVDKFSMAIEAAQLAVDALRDGDTIGLLAFDNRWEWAVEPQVITGEADKDRIKQDIGEIPTGTTTAIHAAVSEAGRAMRELNAPTRHLVLLTDGMEQGAFDYTQLLEGLRADNIHLSTIGIGRDVSRDFLIRLARDGMGRYYFTEQAENVPQIVFKEIDLATREATLLGEIQPHIAAQSPALRGLRPQEMPQLTGYDTTSAKEEAMTALISDAGDPLLAHWQYGLGRVLAFTSEAGQGWGERWLSWPEFSRFWNQSVRWTMGSPASRLLQPSARLVDDGRWTADGSDAGSSTVNGLPSTVTRIEVESLNPDNSFADLADVTAGVRSPSGVVTSTRLLQTAPGYYEAYVALGEPGAYEVLVRRADVQDAEAASETIGFSLPTGVEYLHAGTNDRLLRRINGGAAYMREPGQALDASNLQGASPQREPLWPWFLAPALLLLLVGVGVRRVDFGGLRRRGT